MDVMRTTTNGTQIEMPGFEKPGTFKAKAEYFAEAHGGYSCIIWTLDDKFVSSAHGDTKEKARQSAVKRWEK